MMPNCVCGVKLVRQFVEIGKCAHCSRPAEVREAKNKILAEASRKRYQENQQYKDYKKEYYLKRKKEAISQYCLAHNIRLVTKPKDQPEVVEPLAIDTSLL